MELRTLEQHIAILATMPEASSPVISCYLNLQGGAPGYQDVWNERIGALRKCLTGTERRDFEEGLVPIEKFLQAGTPEGAASLAMFARAGKRPFFLALHFRVPLPTWIAVGPTPNIYHLVEIKDNYDRYVVLLATEESARILAINLGSVTQEIWKMRPDLRRRVGHEWTKEHFQSHRQERIHQFIHEQIRILDRLMSAGGYGHFILAGSVRITAAIRKALPRHLAKKLVDIVPAASNGRPEDVVAATIGAFLEHEERESVSMVDQLLSRIHTNGLAVAGTDGCMRALGAGQADVLLVAKSYQPGEGWECRKCRETRMEAPRPEACPKCNSARLRVFDGKEEMVRMAERLACQVEVVEHSEALERLGGIGCLLRFLAPAQQGRAA